MQIIYGQNLSKDQERTVWEIAKECGVLFDTARLLFTRDQNTVNKAKKYLSPCKENLHNPLLLSGMKEATERITLAKERGENILIFGDYDADGVCAASLLYFSLIEFGIKNLRVYVPEREQGYGLSVDTVLQFNAEQKIDLVITVDCGISDKEKIEQLKQVGIEVIVTDHHEPPESLPECIRINPKIENQAYPFNGLCGAGVAYKLARALIGEKADKNLDVVAVATVADSMDLIDENRDIVYLGLKLINDQKTQRLAFKYLLGENVKQATAQTIAYSIAPRINAGGRMGDALVALKLLLAIDPNKIFDYSVKLNEYNVARQVECDKIYNQAKEIIKKHSLHKRNVILVKNKDWSAGFVGIVAAKLVEDFARPVIVFAGQGENLKGSARSIDGINIYDAICSAKDLLLGFGGHSQAAGVGLEEKNFLAFEKVIDNYVKNTYGKIKYEQKVYAEWDVEKEISLRFASEIEMLEPFGVGNKRPIFSTTVKSVNSLSLRSGSPHYSFNTKVIEMLDFNGYNHVLPLHIPIEKKVLFEVNLSSYKGRQSIKGYVRNVCCDYTNLQSAKTHIFVNELRKLLKDNGNAKHVDNFEYAIGGAGTLYVLSDFSNLSKFDKIKDLPLHLFRPDVKNYNDCIVVSPIDVPEGFDRVIYLDKPLQYLNTDLESQVISNEIGYKFLSEITTEREQFVDLYSKLLTLKNKNFISTASFSEKHADGQNPLQLAFAIEVFMELGIFEVKNSVFTFNEKVKNALTNSTLYSKIDLLKAKYV